MQLHSITALGPLLAVPVAEIKSNRYTVGLLQLRHEEFF